MEGKRNTREERAEREKMRATNAFQFGVVVIIIVVIHNSRFRSILLLFHESLQEFWHHTHIVHSFSLLVVQFLCGFVHGELVERRRSERKQGRERRNKDIVKIEIVSYFAFSLRQNYGDEVLYAICGVGGLLCGRCVCRLCKYRVYLASRAVWHPSSCTWFRFFRFCVLQQ